MLQKLKGKNKVKEDRFLYPFLALNFYMINKEEERKAKNKMDDIKEKRKIKIKRINQVLKKVENL